MITGFRKVVPRNSETLRELKIDLARGTITATDGSAFLSDQLGRPTAEGNYPNWRQVIPEVRSRLSRLTLGKDDIATLRGLKGDSIGFLHTAMPRPMPEGMFDPMPEVIATFEHTFRT